MVQFQNLPIDGERDRGRNVLLNVASVCNTIFGCFFIIVLDFRILFCFDFLKMIAQTLPARVLARTDIDWVIRVTENEWNYEGFLSVNQGAVNIYFALIQHIFKTKSSCDKALWLWLIDPANVAMQGSRMCVTSQNSCYYFHTTCYKCRRHRGLLFWRSDYPPFNFCHVTWFQVNFNLKVFIIIPLQVGCKSVFLVISF